MIHPGRFALQTLAVFAGYVLLGVLGLMLALPPHQASPVYPAAGFALAVLLTGGLRHLPALALAAFVVNVSVSGDRQASSLLLPALISLGAAAQAGLGAVLVRRWCGEALLLASAGQLLRYLLAVGVAGLLSPSCATPLLWWMGIIGPAQVAGTWGVWWLGDLLGVLIAAPITLALIGQPRPLWRPRRLSVALPLTLATALVVLGTIEVNDWDRQRSRADFTRDASRAAQDFAALLREPLLSLEAVHGLTRVQPEPSREEFARATVGFLGEDSPLLALGLAQRVARGGLAAFDAAAQAEGLHGFQARDRSRPGDLRTPDDEDLIAIRLIEPLARNAPALGVNLRSIPLARSATEAAIASGRPTATAGFQLSQDRGEAIGVVVYRSLLSPRTGAVEGMAFATLRPDLMLERLSRSAHQWPAHLAVCIVDVTAAATPQRLAGPPACETVQRPAGAPLPRVDQVLSFADRRWEVRVYDLPRAAAEPSRSWPFALIGLLATGLVGTLLLLMSGRTQRVEDLVRERTAELEREIADRKLGESALLQSEQRLRSIFEHAPVGIAFADVNGGFEEVNTQFCQLTGYRPEELAGKRSTDITHPDDRAEDILMARRVLRGELPYYRRVKRYLRPDGSVVNARVVVSALRGPDGRPQRLLGVGEDISDQLRFEELDRARRSAEAANQAKNDFLSRMSHELRTPMNAILGFTQLMEMDRNAPLPPAQAQRAQQIAQAGWHLLEMINDTLDLSRIESGSLRLDPTVLELAPLIQRALGLIQNTAQEQGLSIHQQLDPAAGRIVGDATRVTQVLTNLLSNAVKYNLVGGSITVSTVLAEPGWVEVAVQDTGIGLSESQRAALFQPFNRLGRENTGLPGTGIGLVISQRLAEMMGGSLRSDRLDGPGSRFVLRLPAAAQTATPHQPQASAHAALDLGQRRVIYVEDNPLNAEVMRGILAQRPGLELEIATTAEGGLQAALGWPPDLLLLDWQLPDGDGLSLMRRLHEALGWLPPVVVVSANALPEQIAAARAAGAQHYLTKPLDVRVLLALVDELLAPAARQSRAK